MFIISTFFGLMFMFRHLTIIEFDFNNKNLKYDLLYHLLVTTIAYVVLFATYNIIPGLLVISIGAGIYYIKISKYIK